MRSIPLFSMLMVCLPAVAQTTINSVANGLFYFPTTWDCTCIPTPHNGQNVVISHTVTLNENLGVYGGALTILEGGALLQDAQPRAMHVNEEGQLLNEGELSVASLWVQDGSWLNTGISTTPLLANTGIITNEGAMLVPDSMYNAGYFQNEAAASLFTSTFYNADTLNNYGSITGVDSLTNAGSLLNAVDAIMECDSALNIGTLHNLGNWTSVALLNANELNNEGEFQAMDLMNVADLNNWGQLVLAENMSNLGTMTNHSGGSITLGGSFLNTSQIPPEEFGTALFNTHGTLSISGNWYNYAIIDGEAPGAIVVQDTTFNFGTLTGNWDLCDMSPLATTPPLIDHDFGIVGDSITFCSTTGIEADRLVPLKLYPNPASTHVTIGSDGWPLGDPRVLDIAGRTVAGIQLNHNTDAVTINIDHLSAGVYTVVTSGRTLPARLVIE